MTGAEVETPVGGRAVVIRTDRESDLDLIDRPHVQAVVHVPRSLPAWFAEIDEAVRSGRFQLERSVVDGVTRADVRTGLEATVPPDALSATARGALVDDVLALVDRLGRRTGGSRFMLRMLIERPSRHCGFHVDTVPTGAPAWGLLRVYNGCGTTYVEPENVVSVAEFYRYVSRREGSSASWPTPRPEPTPTSCRAWRPSSVRRMRGSPSSSGPPICRPHPQAPSSPSSTSTCGSTGPTTMLRWHGSTARPWRVRPAWS